MSPTYSFTCTKCNEVTEDFFSMSSVPDTIKCSKCGKKASREISTGQGFILNGSGWARDGYSGESNRKWIKTKFSEKNKK